MPEESITSVIPTNNVKTKAYNRRNIDQEHLEDLIIKYQSAENYRERNIIYKKICDIYSPKDYIYTWYNKYAYLYNNKDEFISDYYYIFCKSLEGWKPRTKRSTSVHNGKGEFKNYFWSALKNNYINLIKAKTAGKRNIASKCPICDIWVQTLSTHIIKAHEYLLWEQVKLYVSSLDNMTKCPLCDSLKIPTKSKSPEEINLIIKKHIRSEHIYLIFERFHDLYPDANTINDNVIVDSCTEQRVDDTGDCDIRYTPLDILLSCNLSDIQKKIIYNILNYDTDIFYDEILYNCSKEEFDQELENLQQTMIICGFNN